MEENFLITLLSGFWSIFLIIFFFGASIFVHELGHFLAARRRGLKVERFSIGFGPKIFGWNRDGVEYRVSWLPLGGYVALPQLADMQGIEGESQSEKLPPISYSSKVIVSVMGAVFNILFAFAMSLVLWGVGYPAAVEQQTTTIGFVAPSLTLPGGEEFESPAARAGLRPGDVVRAIDGKQVDTFTDIQHAILMGSGRDAEGNPLVMLSAERDGEMTDFRLYPILVGRDRLRTVGIQGAHPVIVEALTEGFPAEAAGIQRGDRIVAIDGAEVFSLGQIQQHLQAMGEQEVILAIERNDQTFEVGITPREAVVTRDGDTQFMLGFRRQETRTLVYRNPVEQVDQARKRVFQMLGSLVNPQTDVGLRHMSGPAGIARIIHWAAQADFRLVLFVMVLINVNLAILNLLPIPVLDGGHIVFATIAKLRGKSLPPNFIATTQGVFMMLLLFLMLYVTFFDLDRWWHDSRDAREYRESYIEPVPADPDP
jgi:regulator of sigma E protease